MSTYAQAIREQRDYFTGATNRAGRFMAYGGIVLWSSLPTHEAHPEVLFLLGGSLLCDYLQLLLGAGLSSYQMRRITRGTNPTQGHSLFIPRTLYSFFWAKTLLLIAGVLFLSGFAANSIQLTSMAQ